ncbi:MAG: hypothetical protein Q4F05_03515 [bacterium]|nr:hypothetical protein [bacterium]
MQAKGIFYVTDCNKQSNEEKGQTYLALDVTEVVENKLRALELDKGNFRCIYMGEGIEAGYVYELELELFIASNCSFTTRVVKYRQLDV